MGEIFDKTCESLDPKLESIKSNFFIGAIMKDEDVQFLFKKSPLILTIDQVFNPVADSGFWADPKENRIKLYPELYGYKIYKIETQKIKDDDPLVSEYKFSGKDENLIYTFDKISVVFKLGDDTQTRIILRSYGRKESHQEYPVEWNVSEFQ